MRPLCLHAGVQDLLTVTTYVPCGSDKRVRRPRIILYIFVYVYTTLDIIHYVSTMSMSVFCIPYVYRFSAPPAKSPKGRGLCTPRLVYIRVRLGYPSNPGIILMLKIPLMTFADYYVIHIN